MATYFHGNSEIQADGLQTLYLMNPSYVGYSDTPQSPTQVNMGFLNSTGNPLNPANLSQSGHSQNEHYVGIPLQQDPSRPSSTHQEISALNGFIPRLHYNLWPSMNQQQMTSPSAAANNSIVGVTDYASQVGLRQGLSLSLSHQQPAYGTYRTESDVQTPTSAPVISQGRGKEMRVSGGSSSSASGVSNGTSNIQSALLGSKYLKVAQQLLDEVINVGNGVKSEFSKGNNKDQMKMKRDRSTSLTGEGSSVGGGGGGGGGGDSTVRRGTELSTVERQELQMKKAKLVTMLDEVERRYRQYHHQMQIVVTSFEQAAGFGSASTYTSLALQTISKQFRCLKDAISTQIRATKKSLGEEDSFNGGKVEGSKLRFIDHQLRQQRALQQLGMIQNNAWRPQRGLPERSVSILRAWLFEHFLHPYPKDSDKLMLAKQTGLTRSQVSNWFINARVRLWKPMVEEMYLEEIKDQEQNGVEDKSGKTKLNEESGSKSIENSPNLAEQTKNLNFKQDKPIDPNVPTSLVSTSTIEENLRTQAGFFFVGSSDGEGILQGNSKKQRDTELQNSQSSIQSMDMDMKPSQMNRELWMNFGNERQNRDGYSLITDGSNQSGGFGGYHQMGEETGRFDPEQFAPRFSNGVSLTLGLPHCENLSNQTYISNQNIQLGRSLEMSGDGNESNEFYGNNNPQLSHSTPTTYENINMQNRKSFAAQLLPDFVA